MITFLFGVVTGCFIGMILTILIIMGNERKK